MITARTFTAVAVATLLAVAVLVQTGADEIQAAQAVADDAVQVQRAMAARPDLIEALQDAKPGTAQHRHAVADLCHHTRGHDAQLLELTDGSLVCRRSKVVVAKGGAL